MIIEDGTERHNLSGRLARMIRWLLANRARIEQPEKIRVTLDWAGTSASVEIKERVEITSAFSESE